MKKTSSGFALTELLIALVMTAGILASIIATALYSQQMSNQLNQAELALTILRNIAEEMLVIHTPAAWQQQTQAYMPGAILTVTEQQLKLSWPSNRPIQVNCQSQTRHSCVALVIG